MEPLDLLAHPRRFLGGATIIGAVVLGLYSFGLEKQMTAGAWLAIPTAILALLGLQTEKTGRGWLYLLIAWAFGLMAYGAVFPDRF